MMRYYITINNGMDILHETTNKTEAFNVYDCMQDIYEGIPIELISINPFGRKTIVLCGIN